MAGAEEILGIGQSSSALDENELKTMRLMELLALLPPQKSSFTHDCICSNYLSLGIALEFCAGFSNYVENQQSLLGSNFYHPRRNLAGRRIPDAPSMSPVFAPAVLSRGEAQLPLAVTEPPVTPPKSPNTVPPNKHPHNKAGQKPQGVPPPISEKQHNYIKLVLTVVLPTAAFSFIAAFLIFYCCGCNKSKVSGGEPRDDHPLLHMQLANTPGEAISPYINQPMMDSFWRGIISYILNFMQVHHPAFVFPPSRFTRMMKESGLLRLDLA
jgi:hypothetical protein